MIWDKWRRTVTRVTLAAAVLGATACSTPAAFSGVARSTTTNASYVVGVQRGKPAVWECPSEPTEAGCRQLEVVFQ